MKPRQDEGDVRTDTETPIVRFVNKVLVDAIRGGASDVHFEPYEKTYRIRYRTDSLSTRWPSRRWRSLHGLQRG